MTDAQKLYDVLDRLAFDQAENAIIHHRYSPLGAALHTLHELRRYATGRCVCVEQFGDPPA